MSWWWCEGACGTIRGFFTTEDTEGFLHRGHRTFAGFAFAEPTV